MCMTYKQRGPETPTLIRVTFDTRLVKQNPPSLAWVCHADTQRYRTAAAAAHRDAWQQMRHQRQLAVGPGAFDRALYAALVLQEKQLS